MPSQENLWMQRQEDRRISRSHKSRTSRLVFFKEVSVLLHALLSANHHEATLGQRTSTRWADIEALFFTIVKLCSMKMQITDAASSGIALAGDTSIPLEERM
jgi:hypothetical protein